RSIGASATGSIVSGILFALCGFVIQWQGMSNGDSGIWLPLMCYAVHRLHTKPNRSSIVIAALAFSMPVLSGHPETAVHSAFAASALALFLWAFPDRSRIRAFEIRFVLIFIAAGVLRSGVHPSLTYTRVAGTTWITSRSAATCARPPSGSG